MRAAWTAAAAVLLVLAGCSSPDTSENGTDPAEQSSAVALAEPEMHALTDTVIIGDRVTISNIAVTTEGCKFVYEPARDAVKFQLIATVENGTSEEITEVLWPTEITFTDPEGFSVKPVDIVQGEPACDNDNPSEFNRMAAGEKRRAAVTLEAPAGATEMVYNTTLIPGAVPVRWDITDEIEAMGPTTRSGTSSAAALSTSAAPARNDCLVGSYGQPQFQGTQCLDKTVSHCGDPASMESGTTFFTDGSSGWTQQCANVMYPQQVELRQQNPLPTVPSDDDFAGEFEPATPQESLPKGWHCDGPAYLCRDDDASGKTEGQQNWTP